MTRLLFIVLSLWLVGTTRPVAWRGAARATQHLTPQRSRDLVVIGPFAH